MESLEGLLREVEIASMAKVWAYPDDLAPIIAGIREQDRQQGARLVSGRAGGACCRRHSMSLTGREGGACTGLPALLPTNCQTLTLLLQSLAMRLRVPPSKRRASRAGVEFPASGDGSTPGLRRTSSGAGVGSNRGGLAGALPSDVIADSFSRYPMPHVPFLKCG